MGSITTVCSIALCLGLWYAYISAFLYTGNLPIVVICRYRQATQLGQVLAVNLIGARRSEMNTI